MLSRIADSLYWMNRYVERTDGLLRVLHVHYILSLDKEVNRNVTWKPVLDLFSSPGNGAAGIDENNTPLVLEHMMTDTENPNSLKVMVNKARENARGVQDHITKEVWEQVNGMYHHINQPWLQAKLYSYQGLEVIEQLQKHCILYAGTTDITMSRGIGWQFMNLGKFIERCIHTIALTEKHMHLMDLNEHEKANDILQWRHLLLCLSGYEHYLKTYSSMHHQSNVLHQLILNKNFTRSVMYSLSHIDYYLNEITAQNTDDSTSALLRSFGRLYSKVKFLELQFMDNRAFLSFLSGLKYSLLGFGKSLGQHFFSYS